MSMLREIAFCFAYFACAFIALAGLFGVVLSVIAGFVVYPFYFIWAPISLLVASAAIVGALKSLESASDIWRGRE